MNENVYLPEGYRLGSPENRMYVSSLAGLERAMTEGAICEAPAVMCSGADMSLRVDLGGPLIIKKKK